MNKKYMMTYSYNGEPFIGGWYDTKEEADNMAMLSTLSGNLATVKLNPNYSKGDGK